MSHSDTPTEPEPLAALLQQVEDLRHSNRRLVYANVELDRQMQANAEQMRARTYEYEAARNRLQAEAGYYRAQSEHFEAEAKALWVENYELRVRLSALRHRAANRIAELAKRVPALEGALRKSCAALAGAARLVRRLV